MVKKQKSSKLLELNKEDIVKIAKGAGIAGIAAVLIFLAEASAMIDFGVYTPIAVGVACVLVNTARKLLSMK